MRGDEQQYSLSPRNAALEPAGGGCLRSGASGHRWSQVPRHLVDFRVPLTTLERIMHWIPVVKFKPFRMFSGPKNSREVSNILYVFGIDRQMERNLQAGLRLSCCAGPGSSGGHFGKEECGS